MFDILEAARQSGDYLRLAFCDYSGSSLPWVVLEVGSCVLACALRSAQWTADRHSISFGVFRVELEPSPREVLRKTIASGFRLVLLCFVRTIWPFSVESHRCAAVVAAVDRVVEVQARRPRAPPLFGWREARG